jgi:hypothetical protein
MILRQLALFAAGARHVSGLRLEDDTPAATLLQVRDRKNMISRHIMIAGNGPALSDSLDEADLDPVCERRKILQTDCPFPSSRTPRQAPRRILSAVVGKPSPHEWAPLQCLHGVSVFSSSCC